MKAQLADFTGHRIEGFYNGYFSAPLFSHIKDNLWMGGCPEGHLPTEFQFVVSLYPWGQYEIDKHQVRTAAYLYDEGKLPDAKLLNLLADTVNAYCALGTTLVHCQAGLNRSGLIAALALKKQGMTASDAIALLRTQRGEMVLCNRTFQNYLLETQIALEPTVW